MSTPPTKSELEQLAARYRVDEVSDDDVRAVLDVDRWFGGCDVLDLNGEAVETIVRYALLHRVTGALRRAGFSVRGSEKSLEKLIDLCSIAGSPLAMRYHKAIDDLLEELRGQHDNTE